MTVEARKLKLIAAINRIDEAKLREMESVLKRKKPGRAIQNGSNGKDHDLVRTMPRGVKTTFDLEEIIREQAWKGPNKARLNQIIKEMDVQEPIELLLLQRTK